MSEAETVLNAELARLLDGLRTDGGALSAAAEHPVGSGRVDVLVTVGGHRIAVEAKIAKSLTSAALDREADAAAKQAAGRVALAEADFGAVVIYPPDCSVARLGSVSDLRWAAAVTDRANAIGFSPLQSGEYRGLGDFLGGMPRIGDPEQTAQDLERTLKQAVSRLSPAEQMQLIYPFHKVKATGKKVDAEREQASIRVLLMVAAATMFHARLQPSLQSMPAADWPVPDDGSRWKAPAAPGTCIHDPDPASAFTDAWKLILDVDYRPIFEAARDALIQMLGCAAFNLALKDVAGKAISLGAATSHLRYDLLGSVFHRVLDTARHDGSFYTTAAAATLLSGLAIRDDHVDWADPDAAAGLRVCDPACGSGTLLLSAVERIERLCSDAHAQPVPDSGVRQLRLAEMIENSIWGFDINATAIHLAATSLGLTAPDVSFRQMRLFTSQFGRAPDKTVHLGSLDLLTGGAQLQLDTSWGRAEHRQAELGEHEEAARHLGRPGDKVDVVVMNPPFTRDSLRHDQLGVADEAAVKKAEKELLDKKAPVKAKAARLHSSGGMFLLLADHLADERSGTVGFVLPAVVATSTGNLDFRKFLAARFAIEYLVVSHDPDRINFSGNTAISEMLIVARRAKEGPPPRLAVLLRNPANPLEARLTLEAIREGTKGAVASGEVLVHGMDPARVAAGDWRQAGFVSEWLHERFLRLEGTCSTLNKQAPLRLDGRAIRGAYKKTAVASGRRALWEHKAHLVTSMAARTDCWIEAKPQQKRLADSYWRQRSRILVANRLFFPTMRLTAVWTDVPAVGSAFCPALARDDNHAKALCVWLNSSLGILGLYGNRTLRKLSYPRFSMEDLRRLPVPEVDDERASLLAAAFNEHAASTMLPFKSMNDCAVRAALDTAVADVLGTGIGFSADDVGYVRQALAAEPSISGTRPC